MSVLQGSYWRLLLFPEKVRQLPGGRWIRIVFRTSHILLFSILLGGHVFDVPSISLLPYLYGALATGIVLIAVELYESCNWFYQGMGVAVCLKLALLLAVPLWWEQRVWMLVVVAILGSVGSHMPGRFRHYSLLHRRIIDRG